MAHSSPAPSSFSKPTRSARAQAASNDSDTSSLTNFKTPTSPSSNSSISSPPNRATSSPSATTIKPSIASAAHLSAASSSSSNVSPDGRADSTPYRVTLTENYRSTPNILRVATQVIAQNEVSSDFPNKVLAATHPEGERIRIAELSNEDEEAVWVASELERLHRAGTAWRDFAILYRQHNHRDRLAKELAVRNIPFVISRLSILEHPLVRDVLAYLRLINKPFDDIAAARVLAAPAWHLEPVDLVRLAERTRKKRTSIYDTLQSPQVRLAVRCVARRAGQASSSSSPSSARL